MSNFGKVLPALGRQLHLWKKEEKTGLSQEGEGGAKHKVLWKLVWGK